jgi:CheY-like chemotaxis protein
LDDKSHSLRQFLRVASHIFHSTGSRFRGESISMATILVAEDNADARRPLVRLLKMEGYDVLIATDALEAMACAQRGHPDLILLDVAMPPIDGLTLLSRLREMPECRDVPVILVTGMSDELTHARATELGVKEYLVKSQFTPEKLLSLIRLHLRTKPTNPAPA